MSDPIRRGIVPKMNVCEPVCVSLWKGLKNQVQVKMNIVSCPPVTTVLIKRPDLKYQLGFSVQNGIVSTTPGFTKNMIYYYTGMLLVLILEGHRKAWTPLLTFSLFYYLGAAKRQLCDKQHLKV